MGWHWGSVGLSEEVPGVTRCHPQAADPLVPLLPSVTEEGQRAQRAGRPPCTAVFRRRPDPPTGAP